MNKRPSEHELETGLQRMFPAPDAIFVNGLEERLLQQAAAQFRPAERRRWVDVFRARTWATAAVAVALAIIAIVAVVGPQETLAAVQRLIGYIPGIGFVENPQQTWRVLSEPVAVRYAWADNPVCNLYNKEGLPASPFRTDDWQDPPAPAKK